MDLSKPDPSKSSSLSPPEDMNSMSSSQYKRNSDLNDYKQLYLDNFQLRISSSTNLIGIKQKLKIPTTSEAHSFVHDANGWINTDGTIRSEKFYVSSNGRRLICAESGMQYKEPRKDFGYGRVINQLSHQEKSDLIRSSNNRPFEHQVKLVPKAIEVVKAAWLQEISNLQSTPTPRLIETKTKLVSAEFYREYPVGLDSLGVKSKLKQAIDFFNNRKFGTFVRSEEYGDGALNWHINYHRGQKYSELKLNSYVKGAYLRLEVKFNKIPRANGSFQFESPYEALMRLSKLAEEILSDIETDLKLEIPVIDEHRLRQRITELLPRSPDSKRIDRMLKSLCETGTYTPSQHAKDIRATKYQLKDLVKGMAIEPILEHLPPTIKRKPKNLSFRLCEEWLTKGEI